MYMCVYVWWQLMLLDNSEGVQTQIPEDFRIISTKCKKAVLLFVPVMKLKYSLKQGKYDTCWWPSSLDHMIIYH